MIVLKIRQRCSLRLAFSFVRVKVSKIARHAAFLAKVSDFFSELLRNFNISVIANKIVKISSREVDEDIFLFSDILDVFFDFWGDRRRVGVSDRFIALCLIIFL